MSDIPIDPAILGIFGPDPVPYPPYHTDRCVNPYAHNSDSGADFHHSHDDSPGISGDNISGTKISAGARGSDEHGRVGYGVDGLSGRTENLVSLEGDANASEVPAMTFDQQVLALLLATHPSILPSYKNMAEVSKATGGDITGEKLEGYFLQVRREAEIMRGRTPRYAAKLEPVKRTRRKRKATSDHAEDSEAMEPPKKESRSKIIRDDETTAIENSEYTEEGNTSPKANKLTRM
ncbi:MAG: hypothetical protein Q9187_004296 [Circinaria calcarea]